MANRTRQRWGFQSGNPDGGNGVANHTGENAFIVSVTAGAFPLAVHSLHVRYDDKQSQYGVRACLFKGTPPSSLALLTAGNGSDGGTTFANDTSALTFGEMIFDHCYYPDQFTAGGSQRIRDSLLFGDVGPIIAPGETITAILCRAFIDGQVFNKYWFSLGLFGGSAVNSPDVQGGGSVNARSIPRGALG